MATLAKCLQDYKDVFTGAEVRELKRDVRAFKRDGMEARAAEKKAGFEKLLSLEKERDVHDPKIEEATGAQPVQAVPKPVA